eukprot:8835845-Pyramimonas_sp.AAC.1
MPVHTTAATCTTAYGEHVRHSASAHLQGPAGARNAENFRRSDVSSSICKLFVISDISGPGHGPPVFGRP